MLEVHLTAELWKAARERSRRFLGYLVSSGYFASKLLSPSVAPIWQPHLQAMAEESARGVDAGHVIRRTSGFALTDLRMCPVSRDRAEELEAGPLLFVHSTLYSSAQSLFACLEGFLSSSL